MTGARIVWIWGPNTDRLVMCSDPEDGFSSVHSVLTARSGNVWTGYNNICFTAIQTVKGSFMQLRYAMLVPRCKVILCEECVSVV